MAGPRSSREHPAASVTVERIETTGADAVAVEADVSRPAEVTRLFDVAE